MKYLDIARRKLAEQFAQRHLRGTPAWEPLQAYLHRTKSTGCGYIDYWHLYRAVRKFKPREILELGTGASTIVLAHACMENGFGRVVSMEESPAWYEHALRLLPAGLPVEIVLSGIVEDTFSIFRGMRYSNVPEREYEFVFVDGPSYRNPAGDVLFDLDLITVVAKATKPLRGIIDKRVSTCYVAQRVLPGKVRYAKTLGLGFVDAVTKSDLRVIDPETPSRSFRLQRIVEFDGV